MENQDNTVRKEMILAVDDEDGITEFIQFLFEAEGFEVKTASGGWQAWDYICKESFDFVLTDVRMDRGDGIELVEKVRDMLEPKPKIAIMSAYTDVLISDVYDRGAVAFVSKPTKSNNLVSMVRNALRKEETKWLSQIKHKESLLLTQDFESIEDALRLGLISYGKGGMFLQLSKDFPPEDHHVDFNIEFSSGSLKHFAGQGIVKWKRSTSSRLFYSGVGIEFVGFTSEMNGYFLHHLHANKPTAFIPIGMIPNSART